jgi:biopolymer transport protein ExbB
VVGRDVTRRSLAVAVLAVACSAGFSQDPWERARDAARAELAAFREAADREVAERRARIAELRAKLLETSDRASKAEIDAAALDLKLEERQRALDAARDALDPLQSELAAASAAISEKAAPAAEAPGSRPAEEALRHVISALEQRLADAATVRAEGPLVRVGELQWIEVLPDGRAIVGRPGRTSPVGPLDVPGIAAVRDALAAGAPPPFVPIDPTGRLDATPPPSERDLAGWFRAGGPVVVVIVVLGGLGLLLGIWRLVRVLLEPAPSPELVARAGAAALAGDREGAARVLRGRRGAVHAALAEVALVNDRGDEASRDARVEQILLRTVDGFERFLQLVAVLAAVSPLLGLLGTVIGMIRMFDALAGGGAGSTNVEALSGGIGEALITTEAGLIFAVPLILLHAAISARADRLEAGLEDAALEIAGRGERAP